MAEIRGTQGRDVLQGTNSRDIITTYNGNDTVWAWGGNDVVYGGNNLDWLFGGDGHDALYGRAGDDWLGGDKGNDYLDGGAGNDRMEGGRDNDIYIVEDEGDRVIEYANEGIDTISVYLEQFSRNYGMPDHVENLHIFGDYRRYGPDVNSVFGNNLSNHITLRSSSWYRVYGFGGDDTIIGHDTGLDFFFGGNGNDTLDGKGNDDEIRGGHGHDRLIGGFGNDHLFGDHGNDIVQGGANHDYLVGYDPRSNTLSKDDVDILEGGGGRDTFALAHHSSDPRHNRNPYAQGAGYGVIEDFNRFEDTINLTHSGGKSAFSLGVGDYDGDGRRDDTAIYYGSHFNALIGVVKNNTGLSLNHSYFR